MKESQNDPKGFIPIVETIMRKLQEEFEATGYLLPINTRNKIADTIFNYLMEDFE